MKRLILPLYAVLFFACCTFSISVVAQELYWSQTAPYPFDAGGEVPTNSVIVNPDGYYFAATGDGAGIYRSIDSGKTWQQSGGSSWYSHCLSYCITPSGKIIAAMNRTVDAKDSSWLLASTDKGANFKKLAFPNIRIGRLHTGSNGYLYAATDLGVYRSTDDGISWASISNGLIKGIANCVILYKNALYVAIEGEGIFRSNDQGNTWKDTESGVEFNFTRDLALLPDGSLAAATQYGAFRSTNGSDWTVFFGDARTQIPMQTVFGSKDALFVGLNGAAGYVSRDQGATWAQLLSGFKSTVVNAFAMDSTGNLLAATNTGVFRATSNATGLLALEKGLVEFEQTAIGATSTQTVLLSNAGNAPLTIKSASTFGFDSDEFGLSKPLSTKVLQPGDTMSVTITFTPKKTGNRETDLRFSVIGNLSSSDHIVVKGVGTETSSVANDSELKIRVESQGSSILAQSENPLHSIIAYSLVGEPSIPEIQQTGNGIQYQWNHLSNGVYIIVIHTLQTSTTLPIIINR